MNGLLMGPSDIKNESQRAELIRKSDLIIFDELLMTHRFCIEALERTLRDIRHSQALYGGITLSLIHI